MRNTIMTIGTGHLADLVHREISGFCRAIRRKACPSRIRKSVRLAVFLKEEEGTSLEIEAEKMMMDAGIPWLLGFSDSREGWIGPLVRPEMSGCSQCADKRRKTAWAGDGFERKGKAASRLGLIRLSLIIAAEVRRVLQGTTPQMEGKLYRLDFESLEGSVHAFLPDPACDVCGGQPPDMPEAARITLKPSLKISRGTYRCKSMDERAEELRKDYQDDRTGLLRGRTIRPNAPFCDSLAILPSVFGDEITAGRSHSYRQSEWVAVMEGLERYCGTMPRGKQFPIHDCYRSLSGNALHPKSVGLYSEEQYSQPYFPFEPFDEEAPMDWVWGYSFLQERPILVPEQLAYYSTGSGSVFVMEGSNGCALGGTLEEAIYYGILEVVERDAFLMTWYARLPVPRLDTRSAGDTELLLMIDRLEAVAGYELRLFNCTMENGIPSIWALAKNKKKKGANLICAAGAHPDPVRAAKSAVYELAAHAFYLDEMYETRGGEFIRMLEDPELVGEMPDHALLYTVPEAEVRLGFLLDPGRPLRTFEDEFTTRVWHPDLTEDLKDLLQVFHRAGLDVIVVDQTTAEIGRNGLHCVKVIIPGMLPMTFGHHLRRVTGLDRLKSVPFRLGYTTSLFSLDEVNPHPHPFL